METGGREAAFTTTAMRRGHGGKCGSIQQQQRNRACCRRFLHCNQPAHACAWCTCTAIHDMHTARCMTPGCLPTAVPRQSLLDIVVGHVKWLLLLVVSFLFVWIPQTLLLLLGATIGYAFTFVFHAAAFCVCSDLQGDQKVPATSCGSTSATGAGRAKTFFRQKDRSGLVVADPPGLQHTTLNVNGVK